MPHRSNNSEILMSNTTVAVNKIIMFILLLAKKLATLISVVFVDGG